MDVTSPARPRVLVAGGLGFVGSHYVRTLLAGGYPAYAGATVTVLDRADPAVLRTLDAVTDRDRLRLVRGDIADPGLLAEVVPGHDVAVNFAAETHVDRSIGAPAGFVHSNVVGAQALLHACLEAGVRTVVQASTDEVYGSIDTGAWAEDAPLAPSSPYSASKAAADLMALAYRRTYGLDVRITRATNTYGPYQLPDKLIPRFATTLVEGGRVPLYGDGLHVRQWLHVGDHCRAVQVVLERGAAGEIYNVGGGCELTNRAVTGLVLDACGAGSDRVEPVADRPGHDRRYSVDWSKIAVLGYTPSVGSGGITSTVRWYVEHRAWWAPLKRVMTPPR